MGVGDVAQVVGGLVMGVGDVAEFFGMTLSGHDAASAVIDCAMNRRCIFPHISVLDRSAAESPQVQDSCGLPLPGAGPVPVYQERSLGVRRMGVVVENRPAIRRRVSRCDAEIVIDSRRRTRRGIRIR